MLLDAVTNLIKNYDVSGRYFDRNALDSLKSYYQSGTLRLQAVAIINANSPELVKNAGRQLFEEVPELIRAGGNAYTTRRYSACLRDMDYYLRYASYALVAGDNTVLDERVLQGLKETYNSLGVPIAPTVRGIQIMKEMIKELVLQSGIDNADFVDAPFDHLTRELSDISI